MFIKKFQPETTFKHPRTDLSWAKGQAKDKRTKNKQSAKRRTNLAINTKLFVDGWFVLMESKAFFEKSTFILLEYEESFDQMSWPEVKLTAL